MAASAHAVVQRLDADLAGAYARAAQTAARSGAAGFSHVPAHCRRQRAGGAGASAVRRWTDLLWRGPWRAYVGRRRPRRLDSHLALWRQRRDRIFHIGLPRLARADASRIIGDRLGAAVDAGALAAAVARGLARGLSAHRRALRLGQDRTRSGEKLAAGRQFDPVAVGAGTLFPSVGRDDELIDRA